MQEWNHFLTWEKTSSDTIDFKTTYVDIVGKKGICGKKINKKTGEPANGDIVSGLLLSQIVYWYLPNKNGQSKLKVKKSGHYWIVKNRDEWYDEIRLTEANYKTAIARLKEEELVITKTMKDPFDQSGQKNAVHIRLNLPEFVKRWNLVMESVKSELESQDSDMSDYFEEQLKGLKPAPLYETVDSTVSEMVDSTVSEMVDFAVPETVDSTGSFITESTSENFSKINLKESIYQEIVDSKIINVPIQKLLIDKIDTLINFEIKISDIELHLPLALEQGFSENEYAHVLKSYLNITKEKPGDFAALMFNWLNRNRKLKAEPVPEQPKKAQPQYGSDKSKYDFKKPVRSEQLPNWMVEREAAEAENKRLNEEMIGAVRPMDPEQLTAFESFVSSFQNDNMGKSYRLEFLTWLDELFQKLGVKKYDFVSLKKAQMDDLMKKLGKLEKAGTA